MYVIKTEASFDSAHFLHGYVGKCGNIHGHRWRIVLEICQDELSEEIQSRGMVVDFTELKADLKALADYLDHCLIIEEGTLKPATLAALEDESFRIVSLPFRPTAENFAKYIYDQMSGKGYRVNRAVVYETPRNCAAYSKDGEISYEL